MNIGDTAEPFSLPSTDGSSHGPEGVTAVAFTCNHCPYAIAWHDRLLDVARDYEGRARVLLVNPNDAERYPRDSFEAMKQRVEGDGGWPAPYLRDETQEVARGFGAKTTPDVFVLDADGVLRYRGAPDADHRSEEEGAAWLRAALEDLMGERAVSQPRTEPVGCSVKWR